MRQLIGIQQRVKEKRVENALQELRGDSLEQEIYANVGDEIGGSIFISILEIVMGVD